MGDGKASDANSCFIINMTNCIMKYEAIAIDAEDERYA